MSPGGTVTLPCGSNAGAVSDGHYSHGIQQKSGQVPRTLIYDTNSKHSWMPPGPQFLSLGAELPELSRGPSPNIGTHASISTRV